MKKNRILGLMLSIVMMLTVIFPAGVFSEEIEILEFEPAEEIVLDFSEDLSVEEEPQTEDVEELIVTIEEASEIELQEEEALAVPEVVLDVTGEENVTKEASLVMLEAEELPFEQGYVRVNGGTTVYAADSKQEDKGYFADNAIAYAIVTSRGADEADDWLWIVFDTEDARNANDALLSGYVQFKDVAVLSDEEVNQLAESLKNDYAVRSYGEMMLPTVSFVPKAEKIDEGIVIELIEDAVISDEVFLTGSAEAPAFTVQPESQTKPLNATVSFTADAGNDVTYQWQYKSGSGWKNLASGTTWVGADTKTLSFRVTATRATYEYRVVASNEGGETVSEVVTVTIDDKIIIDDVTYEAITTTTCRVVAYNGTESAVTIPAAVQGMTVTEIGEKAFMDNTSLESIELPNSITVIRAQAFKNCSNLRTMTSY